MQDINSSKGYRLGSTREVELEEALRDSCITNSELIEDFKNYRKVYSEFSKNIKQDKSQLQLDLNQTNKDKKKLSKHIYQLIDEVKRLSSELDTLTSQINQLQISNAEYGAKDIIRLKKIKSLQSMNEILNKIIVMNSQEAVLRVPNSSDIQNKPEGRSKDHGSSSLPPMKLYLMDIDEANKHESIRNVGHPAMSWPFSKVVIGKSDLCMFHHILTICVTDFLHFPPSQ
ncbi:10910_t:CDS:2 [Ambispora gerdemannii]|uniref:10910_t:CDS:1 n=1 Tax=Ambispora gerdemannii TaxID=144530 RepID=A0A9N9A7M1_9GLOM|nr:10910_t:CDS:2 [Ambispora gerdemannii]